MKIGNIGNTSNVVPKVEPANVPHSTSPQAEMQSMPVSHVVRDEILISTPKSDDETIKHHEDVIDQSVKQANQSLKQYNRVIDRTVHEVTKAVIYTIKDTNTNEVIAEFPSKKIQDMMAKMWELAGMFVDDKA